VSTHINIGDIVKLRFGSPLHNGAVGLIVEYLADGYRRHSLGVLWTSAGSGIWDNRISWHASSDLEILNKITTTIL
jgi:hypothetical protein